jgi:hypothetical protein
MIQWKGYGRNQSRPTERWYQSIWLEGLSKTMKILDRIACSRQGTELRTPKYNRAENATENNVSCTMMG